MARCGQRPCIATDGRGTDHTGGPGARGHSPTQSLPARRDSSNATAMHVRPGGRTNSSCACVRVCGMCGRVRMCACTCLCVRLSLFASLFVSLSLCLYVCARWWWAVQCCRPPSFESAVCHSQRLCRSVGRTQVRPACYSGCGTLPTDDGRLTHARASLILSVCVCLCVCVSVCEGRSLCIG
jgi:hypothetical protein